MAKNASQSAGAGLGGSAPPSGKEPPRSMDDAIRRARAAAASVDQRRAFRRQQRIFHLDVRVPNHPHAHMVRRWSIAALVAGALILVILPDVSILHALAFAGMFALILIVVPNFVLHRDGSLSPTKMTGWAAILLLCGAMTAVAMGPTGNLWSWAPWMSQFYNHTTPATHPHN